MDDKKITKNGKKVNLFIIGIPRCGTSSLYQYLKQHPEIEMGKEKEPGYFCGRCDFKKYFENFSFDKTIIGEATTMNIMDLNFIRRILKYNPKAKFIIMFREPKTLLRSLHHNFPLSYFYKTPFDKRIKQEFEKEYNGVCFADPADPKTDPLHPNNYSFLETVKRAYENAIFCKKLISSKNLLIIDFKDLKERGNSVYKRILEFLDVMNVDFLPELRIYNKAKKVKSPLIYILKRKLRKMKTLRRIYDLIVPTNLKTFVHKSNIEDKSLGGEIAFSKEIDLYYSKLVKKLEEIKEEI